MSVSLLLLLGLGVLVDAARRAWTGSEPESSTMMAVAAVSLVVNATVIRMLTRFRKGGVHLRALHTLHHVLVHIHQPPDALAVRLHPLR